MMMSPLRWLVPLALSATLAGCGGQSRSTTPTQPRPSTRGGETTKAATPRSGAANPTSYNGTYGNGAGGRLVVRNFVAGASFSFELKISAENACDGVAYQGKATLSGGGAATTEQGGSMRLHGGTINFEPATELIGMDCARVLDTAFSPVTR